MNKTALFLLAITALGFGAIGAAKAESLILNSNIVVDDSVVRLGDIFRNAGDKKDIVVAPAPGFGRRAIYDANWLKKMVKKNNLSWSPTSSYAHAVIERSSNVYTASELESFIREAISQKKQSDRFEIELENRDIKMHAPANFTGTPAIRDLRIDERSGRFSASLILPGMQGAKNSFRATGRIFDITRVPVLSRQIKPGETIESVDIHWIKQRRNILQNNALTDLDKIIGQTPRRWIREGTIIRAGDLEQPTIIKKGDSVAITFIAGNLMITSQGRALENGAVGAPIRVMNIQSKRSIDTIVTGFGSVKVLPRGKSIANSQSSQQAAIQ